GIEKVPCVQLLITEEVVCGAVKAIGARFEGEVHDAAGGSPEFRGIRVGLHLKFADRVNRGFDHLGLIRVEGSVVGVVVKSVQQVVVVNGALAARAESARPAADTIVGAGGAASLTGRRQRALGKQGQLKVVAAIQGQVFYPALLNYRSLRRIRGP